ncbi:ADP-ribosylglycohydrolase [Micromonospora sp. Llam0]|uniref:ADP-ribosylglycohydrolase family protein n=1 Tax=Micromonospora sp. Llam0 TaxID=2485143 RepID=UPI000F46E961|nr:ADP-ribosylglycohydrolase family protein [Micromonospora sp. Llam0]ROO63122.1 ADP-ribosylglycohydrolase [Micromonospora sp. Llam0]
MDRVRGCLLVSASAEALARAAAAEGAADALRIPQEPPQALRFGPATAQLLVIADHLTRRRGTVDEAELAAELVAEWSRDRGRGYGPVSAEAFARIDAGVPWQVVAQQRHRAAGDDCDEPAARVAPVGLVQGVGLTAVAGRARRTAAVTHAHPLAADAAAVIAVAVAIAARTSQARSLCPDDVLAALAPHARSAEFRSVLQRLTVLVRRGAEPAEVAAAGNSDGPVVLPAVAVALAAFLNHPDDASEALRFAIAGVGGSMPCAAMAGALCGALQGEQALAVQWGLRLSAASRLLTTAGALSALATQDFD